MEGQVSLGEEAFFGEFTDPTSSLYSQEYTRIIGDPENTSATIILPEYWYLGKDNQSYVGVRSYLSGINLGLNDIVSVGFTSTSIWLVARGLARKTGETALEALGGWIGVSAIVYDMISWTTWDTTYEIVRGRGPMPISPIPVPRTQ